MVDLFLALLRILFPLDPVARLREVTRFFINRLLQDIATFRDELEASPEARAFLEGQIASAEDGLQQLIHEHARQITGLPFVFINRNHEHPRRHGRSMKDVLARLERLLMQQANLERLAHRRAERIKREIEEDPLRLDASHQATSSSLRLVEVTHRSLASLSAQHWERWLRTQCADGGGRHARGPPSSLWPFKQQFPRSPASEVAPIYPYTDDRARAFTFQLQ